MKKTVFAIPRHHARKYIKCGAARGVQDVTRNVPFCINVASFTGEIKIALKLQITLVTERTPRLIFVTKETTGVASDVFETFDYESDRCSKIPEKI